MVTPSATTMKRSTINSSASYWFNFTKQLAQHKIKLLLALIILTGLFAYNKPQQFTDLWLTRDQQGQLLFNFGHYQQASIHFKKTQWQAYSSYGAEQYKNAVSLYGQFNDTDSQVAKANALAHSREYIKARNLYQQILSIAPQNSAAKANIIIVQDIIDEVNRLSASQQAEKGDSSKELGDEPQTGDGAEKKAAIQAQKIEQLSAEQLLLDPSLNDMWLRQVQKNPANFLSQKFYMQQALKDKQPKNQPAVNSNNSKKGLNDE